MKRGQELRTMHGCRLVHAEGKEDAARGTEVQRAVRMCTISSYASGYSSCCVRQRQKETKGDETEEAEVAEDKTMRSTARIQDARQRGGQNLPVCFVMLLVQIETEGKLEDPKCCLFLGGKICCFVVAMFHVAYKNLAIT